MSLPSITFYNLRFPRHKILKVKITMARSKFKSRSHHDVAHTYTPQQCSYQVSTSYTLQFLRHTMNRILKVHAHAELTPNQCPFQASTSYMLQFLRYSLDKILNFNITTAKVRGKINVTPLHCTPTPLNQCPYPVSNFYTLRYLRHSQDTSTVPATHPPLVKTTHSQDKILKVKVTMARSNQGHTMTLHTYTPQPLSL